MGLVVSQIRLLYLQQQRLDLEYKIQLITQTKMGLSKATSDLMEVGNDYDPESPTTKMFLVLAPNFLIISYWISLVS